MDCCNKSTMLVGPISCLLRNISANFFKAPTHLTIRRFAVPGLAKLFAKGVNIHSALPSFHITATFHNSMCGFAASDASDINVKSWLDSSKSCSLSSILNCSSRATCRWCSNTSPSLTFDSISPNCSIPFSPLRRPRLSNNCTVIARADIFSRSLIVRSSSCSAK